MIPACPSNSRSGSARPSLAVKALRILIVEDEMLIAMLMAELLSGLGHTVIGVEMTQSGTIAAAAGDRPDLMIVDARLREGSGIAAVAEILRGGFIPHIFVSGDSLRDQVLHPSAIVVEKPFDDIDLVTAIDRAVATGCS
ncbi:response regulator receiver protein [Gluconacetobacter diazotrophicus PA1 5]|uniref:Response regulator n=2 Tax=Gluconacetobacter diazotrophicus TaxID=33996 RepID=A0A7W4I768_GLUDI|nr:response regulator [Gluconacetobacter diazotrophicus]ACI52057.1 response regulator receiver protein [Gluconacetobacter diazotrophicus PA1 5]MBB2157432.1 response regulator [Gluconacetobacter diazotrophicus]TWB03080.1 response regulator receiver domain-containing protein [Gluconacetobacter diazotrophicus]CAP54177.1 putative response regulator [Gluconacetobacter diazotrophicus PA1 5]